MLPGLVLGQALPKQGVACFSKGSAVRQPCFLETGDVDLETSQLLADDGCLAGVVDELKIQRESGAHRTDVPACEAKCWRLLVDFLLIFAWCRNYARFSGCPLYSTNAGKVDERDGVAPY